MDRYKKAPICIFSLLHTTRSRGQMEKYFKELWKGTEERG
ncbi:hypothetical protein EV2_033328 [Malus domestica]